MSTITVLCPNGRRQTIKTTPTTSILYILEDACKRQNFDPGRYELKHHQRAIDLSLTVHYANIPNKSVLEMVELHEKRAESSIKIGLQLETGQRLFAEFNPNFALYDILHNWKEIIEEDMENITKKPIITYMRREIVGIENLKKTTLRMLGLLNGSAVLRLLFRETEMIGKQASVVTESTKPRKVETKAKSDIISTETNVVPVAETVDLANKDVHMVKTKNFCSLVEEKDETLASSYTSEEPSHMDLDDNAESSKNSMRRNFEFETKSVDQVEDNMENIIILGDRDAMVFNLDDIKPISNECLPDDFFELGVDDVRYLMRDLKCKRQELEDVPLQTKHMRDSKKLTNLKEYKKCYIRVQFPDRMVLQGIFRPLESVAAVMEFVQKYTLPDIEFKLYTTPPKKILEEQSRLFDEDFVPAAVVHFGSSQALDHYLRPDVMEKVSTYQAASKAAFNISSSNKAPQAESSNKRLNSQKSESKVNKIPKWFKLK